LNRAQQQSRQPVVQPQVPGSRVNPHVNVGDTLARMVEEQNAENKRQRSQQYEDKVIRPDAATRIQSALRAKKSKRDVQTIREIKQIGDEQTAVQARLLARSQARSSVSAPSTPQLVQAPPRGTSVSAQPSVPSRASPAPVSSFGSINSPPLGQSPAPVSRFARARQLLGTRLAIGNNAPSSSDKDEQ
jgi:hypothetical protein